MVSIILAVLGLLTALAPVLLDLFRRRQAPTPEQRRDDAGADLALAEARILELEAAGDFAGADALRRVLNDRIAPQRDAGDGAAGQQLPSAAAGGHSPGGSD